MSYNFDGKISNQSPRFKLDDDNTFCSKCNKQILAPNSSVLAVENNDGETQGFWVYSYLTTDHYIYESKSGRSSVYCSKYCRDKHNHRFKVKTEIKEVKVYVEKPTDNRTVEEIVGIDKK